MLGYIINISAPRVCAFNVFVTKVQFPRGEMMALCVDLSLNKEIVDWLVTGVHKSKVLYTNCILASVKGGPKLATV